jgi:hypothetical protein
MEHAMDARVSLITLGVADLGRARSFYEALGFRASSAGGGQVVFLQAGPMALCLWTRAELAADAGVSDGPLGFRGIAIAHNVRTKEAVDATLAEAARVGATITRVAHDADWGGRSGYFADPDGHLWEVAWNPFFPLAEDGALSLPP